MTHDERVDIMCSAVDTYGNGKQISKAIEELSELIRALARCNDRDNIDEEIADVQIMIHQLVYIFDNSDQVKDWMDRKLERLKKRMEEDDEIEWTLSWVHPH